MTDEPKSHSVLDHKRLTLFVASFLMLYFELAVIRWIPGHVHIIAYFTNFVLIACFFGMGVGMVIAKRKFDTVRFVAPLMLGLILLAVMFDNVEVERGGGMWLFTLEGGTSFRWNLYFLLAIFYTAVSVTFIPLGQAVGRGFGDKSPLLDYSANLVGSIAGILVFSLFSFLSLPAWSWFLIGVPLLALLMPGKRVLQGFTIVIALAITGLTWNLDKDTIWSPYHKITVKPVGIQRDTQAILPFSVGDEDVEYLPMDVGFNVSVNNDFYQITLDLSDEKVAQYPALERWQKQYDFPFKLKQNAERVLIVGGGTGNDVAAALRNGAQLIDVVEIDPETAELGKRSHPNRPYSDPRVNLYIDDARHFFNHAEKGSYDVVVFGYLDSQRLLSTLSSLRLDSYVFTVESFTEVRSLLKPDGVHVTSFGVGTEWMSKRMFEMLREAYDDEPLPLHELGVAPAGVVFIAGPGKDALIKIDPRPIPEDIILARDDWPFIYAKDRSIPKEYKIALGLILLVSTLGLGAVGGRKRVPNLHFFSLGVGFMLLQTKNITTIALVFGSTWYVNTLVFLSILVMALLSCLLMSLTDKFKVKWAYVGLFLALALNYVIPLQTFTGGSFIFRIVVVGGLTALPLFFSGIVFAHSFKQVKDPGHALASNVLGGVIGGIVEYVSLLTGMKFLLLFVAIAYLVSIRRGNTAGERSEGAEASASS